MPADMQTLTQIIMNSGLANRALTDSQLNRILDGSPQRRHHLVNRAMKAGELVRLRRGIYLLDARYRNYPAHPFSLAQAFVPGSYVSFETALAYHGWIPEAVRTIASVTPGRKSSAFDHPMFGDFSFQPLAIQKGYVLAMVDRLAITEQTMLVAKPMRALLDLVCLRKIEWQGIGWITEGMRIDDDHLRCLTPVDVQTLKAIYKQKRVISFVQSLAKELGHD